MCNLNMKKQWEAGESEFRSLKQGTRELGLQREWGSPWTQGLPYRAESVETRLIAREYQYIVCKTWLERRGFKDQYTE